MKFSWIFASLYCKNHRCQWGFSCYVAFHDRIAKEASSLTLISRSVLKGRFTTSALELQFCKHLDNRRLLHLNSTSNNSSSTPCNTVLLYYSCPYQNSRIHSETDWQSFSTSHPKTRPDVLLQIDVQANNTSVVFRAVLLLLSFLRFCTASCTRSWPAEWENGFRWTAFKEASTSF